MRYAENTSVSAEKSRHEIERVLQRYGATGFMYGWQEKSADIGFVMHNKQIKFILEMPDSNSTAFTKTPTGRKRTSAQAHVEWEQATRQRWRALALAVKAKLEAVEAGIATFESEFLAHIVMDDGQTIGEKLLPQLDRALTAGKLPKLLPGISGTA